MEDLGGPREGGGGVAHGEAATLGKGADYDRWRLHGTS